jgi:two-component system phosphate regulon sensor histidine kinase PhoR
MRCYAEIRNAVKPLYCCMNWRIRKDRVIPAILLAVLVVLAWGQYVLFSAALRGKEKDFNDKLFAITFMQANAMRSDTAIQRQLADSSTALQFAKQRLRHILDSLYVPNGIPLDYTLALGMMKKSDTAFSRMQPGFDARMDTLLWSSDPAQQEGLRLTKLRMAFLGPAPDRRFFIKVFFPGKTYFLLQNLLPLIIINLLGLLVLFTCFLWLLRLYRKEAWLARIRNDMINNLTHEFKTPLFTISVASKMLLEQEAVKAHPKATSYAEKILTETARLNTLAENVLVSAAAENRDSEMQSAQVQVHTCIQKAVSRMEELMKAEGVQIKLLLKAENDTVAGNEQQLETVFINLLDNAVKYRREYPEVVIETKNEPGWLSIRVADNGIGMREETQKHAFDRFYRGNTGDVHNVKGYGIGLSHVKSIMRLHKGKLELKSAPGKGTEFILQLPCA